MSIFSQTSKITVGQLVADKAKKFLNTKDKAKSQKWVTQGVREGNYIGHDPISFTYLVDHDGYLVSVVSSGNNKYDVVDIVKLEDGKEKIDNSNKEFDATKDRNDKNTPIVEVSEVTTPKESVKKSKLKIDTLDPNKKVFLTDHAIDEAMNDNFELKSKGEAISWIHDKVRKAKIVDDSVIGTDGKERMMLHYGNFAFIVKEKPHEYAVVTIYKVEKQHEIVKNIAVNALKVELQKVKRKEVSVEKKNTLRIAELELEKAECNLRSVKTRRESIKLACSARVKEIEVEVNNLKNEIYEIKREKTIIAKGLVSYA